MEYLDVTHIAVNVPDLRAAEEYYAALFGLDVAWRDSDGAASMFASWDELDAAGVEPEVVLLWRDAFRLALARGESGVATAESGLNHVGLQVSPETLAEVRERVQTTREAPEEPGNVVTLSFTDRYGVRWELDTRSYRDPRQIIRQKAERQRREGTQP